MSSYPEACLRVLRAEGADFSTMAEWLSMYALARFLRPRKAGAPWRASGPADRLVADSGILQIDEEAVLAELDSRGLAVGLRLTARCLSELRREAREREHPAALHPLAPVRDSDGDAVVDCYGDTGDWASVARVARGLLPLAYRVLGSETAFLGSRIWWSFPRTGSGEDELQSGRRFHFDLYSWRSLSAFFYLSDVDVQSGPHVCVAGSHRRKLLRHRLSFRRWRQDAEILAAYGGESVRTILGPAGSGFLEDPTCFHKATPPERNPRLILQLLWGSRDFIAPGFSRRVNPRAAFESRVSDTDSGPFRRAT